VNVRVGSNLILPLMRNENGALSTPYNRGNVQPSK